MHRFFVRVLTCVFFLTACVCAHAQTARFSGQVSDPQGAAVPDAQVHIYNLDNSTQWTVKSDANGNYVAPYLPAGHYRLEIEAHGFAVSGSQTIELSVGEAHIFNKQLGIAAEQTAVNVTADAVTQVHTESNEISGTITGREVTGLQLNGRNFSQLIALAPGVSNQTGQDEAKVGMAGSVSYSVNGGRTEYNAFLVDGSETLNVGINKDHTSLIVTPSIDAIQEIKVLTSNYGAMYPSTGNGTTIVTTKSGTDKYHGNLYYFIRNEMFNAKGYFDVGNRAPLYRRNDFGGTIGGPLSIPHLYEAKGRTHFFFSDEFRIEKTPTAYRQAVPSYRERIGDFNDVCPGGSPATFSRNQYPDCPSTALGGNGQPEPYPANLVNSFEGLGALNRNATAILNTGVIPFPNATSGCNSTIGSCYNVDVSLPTYWREDLFRLDHTFNEKTQLSFRYIHDEWNMTAPLPQYGFLQNSFPTIQNQFYGPGTSLAARLTHTFSSTLLNEFVASYTNSHLTLADKPGAGVSIQRPAMLDAPCEAVSPSGEGPVQASVMIAQCPMTTIFTNGSAGADGVAKMPGVSIAGNNAEYGGVGFNVDPSYMPWEHSNPMYSFSDNVTKIIGQHTIQFGAQWVIYQRNQTNGPIGASTGDTQGILTYSNIKGTLSTGNAFADFLRHSAPHLGNQSPNPNGFQDAVASFQQDSGQARYRQRYQIVEPYVQDDFKVGRRLTINAGVRFSLFGTFHEIDGNAYNWQASAFNPLIASGLAIHGPGQGLSGALLDKASGALIQINQANPSASVGIGRITNGVVQCGANGVPSSCMTGHLFNSAPRVGLAWDALGNGKLAIRAGYGMFYEHGTADEANTGSLEGSAPLIFDMTQNNPTSLSTIGAGNAFPINVTAIPTKAIWPYVQQWSLSVERELPKSMLATFAYVGSRGTHLTTERQINQLQPVTTNPFGPNEPMHYLGPDGFPNGDCNFQGHQLQFENGTVFDSNSPYFFNLEAACYGAPGVSVPDPNTFRPYLGLGQIFSLENIGTSSYNSFQTTLRHTAGPLNLGVAYTYSHSLDDTSDRSDATFVNSYDLKFNKASSNFDQRHLLHISYIYELPLLRFFDAFLHVVDRGATDESASPSDLNSLQQTWQSKNAVRSLLGGWEVSGITLFESGIPFTVVNGGSPNGVGTLDNAGVANGTGSGSYPDLSGISARSPIPVGGNNSRSVGPLLLNPAAFAAPRGLTFGNAGRNVLNNPRRWNTDAALAKHFDLPLKTNLEFRAEAFNIFNVTQFRIYDPALGNQAENTASCYAQFAGSYSAAGGFGTDCLTGSSFLHPVDAHRPRTIQFGLKLGF